MPDGADELAELERRRAELYRELGQVGDFRRGSLNEVRRKCGKPGCACAAPDHPGHGPQWNLTRKVEGRTRAVHLKPGPELEKARREVAEYERFRGLVGQVTEVNEAICQARLAVPGDDADAPLPVREGKKMTCSGSVRSRGCWPLVALGNEGVTSPAQHATMWRVRPVRSRSLRRSPDAVNRRRDGHPPEAGHVRLPGCGDRGR